MMWSHTVQRVAFVTYKARRALTFLAVLVLSLVLSSFSSLIGIPATQQTANFGFAWVRLVTNYIYAVVEFSWTRWRCDCSLMFKGCKKERKCILICLRGAEHFYMQCILLIVCVTQFPNLVPSHFSLYWTILQHTIRRFCSTWGWVPIPSICV